MAASSKKELMQTISQQQKNIEEMQKILRKLDPSYGVEPEAKEEEKEVPALASSQVTQQAPTPSFDEYEKKLGTCLNVFKTLYGEGNVPAAIRDAFASKVIGEVIGDGFKFPEPSPQTSKPEKRQRPKEEEDVASEEPLLSKQKTQSAALDNVEPYVSLQEPLELMKSVLESQ